MITPERVYQVLKRRSPALRSDYDTDLVANQFLDSLMLVEMLSDLEAEFGMELPDELMQIENFRTVEMIAKTFQSVRERDLG